MTLETQEKLKEILESSRVRNDSIEKVNKKLLLYIIKRLDRIERKLQ